MENITALLGPFLYLVEVFIFLILAAETGRCKGEIVRKLSFMFYALAIKNTYILFFLFVKLIDSNLYSKLSGNVPQIVWMIVVIFGTLPFLKELLRGKNG